MATKTYRVNDFWTDIDKENHVDIESVDGVITSVKNNGEDIGGSSDFSTAEVTFIPIPEDYEVVVPWLDDPSGLSLAVTVTSSDEPFTLQVPIYQDGPTYLISKTDLNISGEIESVGGIPLFGSILKLYNITGDCTIS